MATLFGVVSRKDYPIDGWYMVYSPHSRLPMTGVSIKGTKLSVGQQVAIVQSGLWSDERHGFGFAEVSAGIYSHVELTDTRAWVIDHNQIGASLAFLLNKAGKAKEIYHPGRVTAVGATHLTVKDWYTEETLGAWPVVSGLSASDFAVGDGVLLRMQPSGMTRVEGWWETAGSRICGVIVRGRGNYTPILYYPFRHAFAESPEGLTWIEDPFVYGAPSVAAWDLYSRVYDPAHLTFIYETVTVGGPPYSSAIAAQNCRIYAAREAIPTSLVYSLDTLPAENFTFVGTAGQVSATEPEFTVLFKDNKDLFLRYYLLNPESDADHRNFIIAQGSTMGIDMTGGGMFGDA